MMRPMEGLKMKTDKQWRQEGDAQTLATAEQIRQDPSRLKGAQTAAQKLDDEARERANAMAKVANKKDPASQAAKTARTKRKPKGPATSVSDILKVTHTR